VDYLEKEVYEYLNIL